MAFACFGCSLDALDAPEKVAMKLAYLGAKAEGLLGDDTARDPYDLVSPLLAGIPGIGFVGRLEIESFLTPRPAVEDADMVHPEVYRRFADQEGCAVISARLREFVRDRVLPLDPVMIGVDHSLTGGVLRALPPQPGGLALVVLDAHLDAVPTSVRYGAGAALDGSRPAGEPPRDIYSCGTWLASIIESGTVRPRDVLVLGVGDYPAEPGPGEPEGLAAYRESYMGFEESGVRVLTRRSMRQQGIEAAVEAAMEPLAGRRVYVSIDADIAAGERTRAVRFLDMPGLDPEEAMRAAGAVGAAVRGGSGTLAGIDVMEIDVHGADLPGAGDVTVELCSRMVCSLVGIEGGS